MGDLKGEPGERRRYSPGLYITRQSVKDSWNNFLASESLCFGIVGESGTGKTNEICSLADRVVKEGALLGLFYRVVELWNGLTSAIKDDFSWEFEKEEPISRIIGRFTELAKVHSTKLIIFIDGVDEFPDSLEKFRTEITEFVKRLDPMTVRLCFTCKTHDWKSLTHERGESLNLIGRKTFSQFQTKKGLPGIDIGLFTDSELNKAWEAYSSNYQIPGEIKGETRVLCHLPLMLRLVSETYQGLRQPIPSDLSNIAILEHYWERRLEEFDHQTKMVMEQIITRAAQMMTWQDRSELDENTFFFEIGFEYATHPSYEINFRYGFLVRRKYADDKTMVTFPFDKLRSYAYIRGRQWTQLCEGGRIKDEVGTVINTRLGRDTLHFFLQLDESRHGWITPLIEFDPVLFLKAVLSIEGIKISKDDLNEGDNRSVVERKLERFIHEYSNIRNLFPSFKTRITPYSAGEAGILLINTRHMYRPRTKENPQPVVILREEDLPISEKEYRELRPVDNIISHQLWDNLQSELPEVLAFSEISSELAKVVGDQFLDESNCQEILSERIIGILRSEPSISPVGAPQGVFWQLLNYQALEEAIASSYEDISERVKNLQEEWIRQLRKDNPEFKRWYGIYLIRLMALGWNLEQLSHLSDYVIQLGPSPKELFSYLRDGDFSQTMEAATRLAPKVISSYCKLLEKNFPSFLSEFKSYQACQSQLLLEISEAGSSEIKIDYLNLSYIWLPSLPPGPPIVRMAPSSSSLAEVFIRNRKSLSNIFSYTEVVTEVNGIQINEKNAVISRVRYPDRTPIIDQVYQMIANEAEEVFGNHFEWTGARLSSGRIPYYDSFARYLLKE